MDDCRMGGKARRRDGYFRRFSATLSDMHLKASAVPAWSLTKFRASAASMRRPAALDFHFGSGEAGEIAGEVEFYAEGHERS